MIRWKHSLRNRALAIAVAGVSLGALGAPFLGAHGWFGVREAVAEGPGFGMHGPPHGLGGELAPLLFSAGLSDAQKEQAHQIMQSNRDTMKGLFSQLHAADEELATRLLAAGNVTQTDLEPTLTKIAGLRAQVAENEAAVALQVRALLTPAQLAQASQTFQQMSALREQERQLLDKGGA